MKIKLIIYLCMLLLLPQGAEAARLWSSGCELQGDTGGNMTDNLEWDRDGSAAARTQVDVTTKRSGNSSCEISLSTGSWGWFSQQFASANTSEAIYIRFYMNIATLPEEDADMALFGGTTDGLTEDGEQMLVLNTDGTISLAADNGTTIIDTSGSALSTDTWYRVEWLYDSGGDSEVRVDGVQFLQSSSHDGDGVALFALGLCMAATGGMCGGNEQSDFGNVFFDDVAINDTSGSAQTSWPGVGSIVHMQPDGAGDNSGCASGDYASVDEVTPDDNSTECVLDDNGDILDATVESSSTVGIDSYDTVTLVQVGEREEAQGAGTVQWNLRLKSASGGTASDGTTTSHDDTTHRTNGDAVPRNYTLTSYTDPTTSVAWTPTGTNSLDNMQIGMNAVDADPDIGLSTLWALVEYVDGVEPAPSMPGRINIGGKTLKIVGGKLKIAY